MGNISAGSCSSELDTHRPLARVLWGSATTSGDGDGARSPLIYSSPRVHLQPPSVCGPGALVSVPGLEQGCSTAGQNPGGSDALESDPRMEAETGPTEASCSRNEGPGRGLHVALGG